MSSQRKKIKLDESSDYSILNLNDDCLFEILSYLRLGDLCRIGGTCIRLNQLAQKFYSNYTTIDKTLFESTELADYDTLSMIIKQIGHHVESFRINYSRMIPNLLLELVFKYCINLKELTTNYFAFGDDIEWQNIIKSKIFQNLESIHLVYKASDSTNFDDFVTMKTLKNFVFLSINYKWPRNKNEEFLKLHNLESLSVNVLDAVGYNICEKLFDNNPRINKLNLLDGLNDEIINLVVDKLMYLEDLSLNEPNDFLLPPVSDQSMMKISQIRNLKHFRSWKVPRCLLESLVQYDQLETLASASEIQGELVIKFTKLKFLSITNAQDSILNSLKSQTSLEILELSNEHITADCLIKFVSGARNLKYLSLTSNFDDFQNESIIARLNSLFGNRQKKLQFCYYNQDINWKIYKNLIPTFGSRAPIYSPSSPTWCDILLDLNY